MKSNESGFHKIASHCYLELVGELLGLVDDQDRDLAEVVDEVDDGALEVCDELTAAMRGAKARAQHESCYPGEPARARVLA